MNLSGAFMESLLLPLLLGRRGLGRGGLLSLLRFMERSKVFITRIGDSSHLSEIAGLLEFIRGKAYRLRLAHELVYLFI